MCIVTIGGNFQNSLETTSLLKELGAKFVVSRAERDVQAKFLLRNGADEVVYPEKQLAKWAAIRYKMCIRDRYLTLFFLGAFVIAAAEQLPMSVCLYETASAVATVGLTLGITPQLGVLSQGVLIALMFLGRVGGLTLIYAAFGSSPAHSRLPQEKIAIG